MFGLNRWTPFQDIFNFQRDVDKLFNQIWNDMPTRSYNSGPMSPFQVHTAPDQWRIAMPMPGIDPKLVSIDVAGNTISVRAEQSGGSRDGETHFEQTITVPPFLDIDRIAASHRHGMLELTLPLKESVKPRRVEIQGLAEAESTQKQLTTA